MQTQITCPRCRNRFAADIYQVIDVGQQPELKQMLLSGYLNVAVCPSCQTPTQVATPLLYHDAAHELFMVYVPMEMNLNQPDRERLIGQMVRQAVDNTPAEQRRGYMLQPQTIINMQTFMEKVLETEGVTPEMIARQRRQVELLQTMATAAKDVVDILIKEREEEIDETFFGILKSSVTAAEQANQEDQALRLINLQARLMRETAAGRRLEQQQKAIHAFRQEVKKSGGQLTPQLLLQHVIANLGDETVTAALFSMGQQAVDYEFFTLLTEEMEARTKAGDTAMAGQLAELRQELLDMQESMRQQSQQMLQQATETLQAILSAEDQQAAVRANMDKVDDAFMYVLSATIARAEQEGQSAQAADLKKVQSLIMQEVEQQAPPEVQLINRLVRADSEEERNRLLQENRELVTPAFVEMLDMITAEVTAGGENEFADRLQQIKRMIERAYQ